MPLNQKEIRDRAIEFAREWHYASRERAEAQTFWNEFFAIFGLSRRRIASFEEPVKKLGDKRGSIDLLWKGTLLVEHKSRGKNLDSAYEQALDYFPGIAEQDLPQYILVTDFEQFRLVDLDNKETFPFGLADLPDKVHLFGFISGYKKQKYHDEDPVNVQVAEKMGDLHDALLASGYTGHQLELLLVRLMYCLFADDTGIFPKDHFEYILESRTKPDGSDAGMMSATLFQILNTPEAQRQKTLDEELRQFQYINGSLFKEVLPIPAFNKEMRDILLACCQFDWSRVSPAVFGSMFQAVMNTEKGKRRNLGAHYTSEKNILKVVRGLFLDGLRQELEASRFSVPKLRQLHDKLSRLRFFDPACGCGNFLVIAYREIRQLEIEVLKQIRHLSGDKQLSLDVTAFVSRIDVDVMYGMEIEEFPARIAEVALWLTDHQMNMQLSAEFGQTFARLPLKKAANIWHGNALRLEWEQLLPKQAVLDGAIDLYILGNPPFVGKHNRTTAQTCDMDIACRVLQGYGMLDYVCAWYVKAAQLMQHTPIKAAFVSTNSITQGEQVGVLWPYLLHQGIKIHFAHRTFRWTNEARGNAQVYCVIIGFAAVDTTTKHLYDYETPRSEAVEIAAKNISPYLVDTADIVITSRNRAISDAPQILYGSKPVDDGQFFFTELEMQNLIIKAPDALKFIRPVVSAHEFLNGEKRYCLWLKDVNPSELRESPEVMQRVKAVKEFRLQSSKAATRKLADTAFLFGELRQPEGSYVVIPLHSSEQRKYIPMGFMGPENILHNSCSAVQNATLYHFGILTSAMHMAWMRQVCGRIKSDYRYSNNLVYNNFPWPPATTDPQKQRVEKVAQAVLDARALFPGSTLADLYDPNAMPKPLLDAHKTLDAAVDACYGRKFASELERLEFLFTLYRRYTEPLVQATEQAVRKHKRRKGEQESGEITQ